MSGWIVFGTALPVLCQALLEAGIRLLIQSGLLLLVGLTVGRAVRRSGPARQQHVYQATLSAVALCALVSLGLVGHLPALCRLTLPPAITLAAPAAEHDAQSTPPIPSPSRPTPQLRANADEAQSGDLPDSSGHAVTVQVSLDPVTTVNDFEPSTAPFKHFLQPSAAGRISLMGLQADDRPEYSGNQVRAGIHIYTGKGSISFGYWIALPLVQPEDRRDKTRVEVEH